MRNIEIMINDGMLGNKSILLALSALTTGNLNSKLRKESTPYRMKDILPLAHEYIIPELTDAEKAEQVNRSLITYASQSPKAPKKLFHG
jgi:hypothetical protein